ncbi:MAG: Gfo/Idh/MocA family oxidoreductase, partial [Nitrospira sp.]|nr:Gfo/Idh/MocA family oxidoreductase [Nitrospira sp.]
VIGTGFIGPVHVEGLRRAGVEVTGILGSNHEKSLTAARRLHIPRAYANLDELLLDRDVDSVHVTSPNQAHFDQTLACLEARKHVVCEKPLAMDASQSAKLVEIARTAGVAAGVNYNIRYYPLCLEAAARRKNGSLGPIHHVGGSYVQDWLFHSSDFNWRVLSSAGGALRAVADIGTHWLDLIYAITGLEVESVFADLHQVFPQRQRALGSSETFTGTANSDAKFETIDIDTEDYGAVLIRFRGGARGTMWVSQVTAGRKNCLRYEIAAAHEAISWNSESPNQLWIGHRDQANQLLTRDPALLSAEARKYSNYPGGHNEGFPDTFKQLFTDFYESIANGTFASEPTFPTFEDGHREILVCEAILESTRRGSWVNIPQN